MGVGSHAEDQIFVHQIPNEFPDPSAAVPGNASGIDLEQDDEVIGMQLNVPDGSLLFISELGMGKRTRMDEFNVQYRGGKGIKCYRVNEKTGNLVGCLVADENQELLIITTEGTIIRIKVSEISTLQRNTSGVRLINIDPSSGVRVSSVEVAAETPEDESEPESEPEGTSNGETSETADDSLARMIDAAETDGEE